MRRSKGCNAMQRLDQKFKSLFWCWTFYRKHIFSKSAFLRIRWYFNKVLYVRKEVTAFIICQSSFKLQTYPDRTNFTWFISDIRYLQSSDLFSRSNALCKLCLRVAISFCSVNKHLTCPILPIFLRYFISSMASPSIKLNWNVHILNKLCQIFKLPDHYLNAQYPTKNIMLSILLW